MQQCHDMPAHDHWCLKDGNPVLPLPMGAFENIFPWRRVWRMRTGILPSQVCFLQWANSKALVFPTGEGELAHPLTKPESCCFTSLWHINSTDVENVILTTQWLGVSHAFVLSGCTLSPFRCWSDSGLWFFQGHYLQGINLFPSPCLLPLKFVFLSLFVLSDRANTIDGAFSSQYP